MVLTRAFVEGEFSFDLEKAEEHFSAALGSLDEDCDPWLPLFIHHSAARVILTDATCDRLNTEELLKEVETRGGSPEERLKALFFREVEELEEWQRAAIVSGCSHLELAETLYQELASEELKIKHLWCWSQALQTSDPARGLECLCAAAELAQKLGYPGWVHKMMGDFFYLHSILDRTEVPAARRQEVEVQISSAMRLFFGPSTGPPTPC
jgi:hypothetical protein